MYFLLKLREKKSPTGRKLYQSINDLIVVGNTLVHSKSVEIDINVLMKNDVVAEEIYNDFINSMIGNGKRKSSRHKGMQKVLESSHNIYLVLLYSHLLSKL